MGLVKGKSIEQRQWNLKWFYLLDCSIRGSELKFKYITYPKMQLIPNKKLSFVSQEVELIGIDASLKVLCKRSSNFLNFRIKTKSNQCYIYVLNWTWTEVSLSNQCKCFLLYFKYSPSIMNKGKLGFSFGLFNNSRIKERHKNKVH